MKLVFSEIRRNLILLTSSFLVVMCVGCSPKAVQPKESQSALELKALVKDGAYLVDVRTPEEFAEGHVAGSVNVPLATLEENLKQLEGKKHIVVYCKGGVRSGKAANLLKEHGFTNVIDAVSWKKVDEELNE